MVHNCRIRHALLSKKNQKKQNWKKRSFTHVNTNQYNIRIFSAYCLLFLSVLNALWIDVFRGVLEMNYNIVILTLLGEPAKVIK